MGANNSRPKNSRAKQYLKDDASSTKTKPPTRKKKSRKSRKKNSSIRVTVSNPNGTYIGNLTRKLGTRTKKLSPPKMKKEHSPSEAKEKLSPPKMKKEHFVRLKKKEMGKINELINEGELITITSSAHKKVYKTENPPIEIITLEQYPLKNRKVISKAYKEEPELKRLLTLLYDLKPKYQKYLLLPTHYGTVKYTEKMTAKQKARHTLKNLERKFNNKRRRNPQQWRKRYMKMPECRELDYLVWIQKEKEKIEKEEEVVHFPNDVIKTNLIGLLETVNELHKINITCLDIKRENIFVDCGKDPNDVPYFVLGDVNDFTMCDRPEEMFGHLSTCIMTHSWFANSTGPFSDYYAILLIVVIIYNDTVKDKKSPLYLEISSWVDLDEDKLISRKIKALEDIIKNNDKWKKIDKMEKFALLAIRYCLNYKVGYNALQDLNTFYKDHIKTIIDVLGGKKTKSPTKPSFKQMSSMKLMTNDIDFGPDSDSDWDANL